MKKWIVLILLGGFMLPSISSAIDLKQSKFTQVVNNVEIISKADNTRHAAAVNDVFSMPDVLRTGPNSRAELDAVDGTITRVGANTIFSFDPGNRTIDLQQGSLLFHSPHGKGGGTIRTGSATASVIGTTIIITATPNGGFKLLDLEGSAEVRFLNGLHQTIQPGQMTFILPSGAISPILVFRLDAETKGSTLVNGFSKPLDSQSRINDAITQQLLQILNGTAADTGLLVGNNATPQTVQVVMDIFNNSGSAIPVTDASIVGNDRASTLPVNYSPLDPAHVVTTSFTANIPSISQGMLFLGLDSFASGFVGKNIDIDTAHVDLSSFAGNSDFDFVAEKDLRIWQSTTFDDGTVRTAIPSEENLPDTIALLAGGQMLIAPGATLEADTGTFGLVADSFGTLDTETGTVDEQNTLEANIYNDVGDIDLLSLQSLNVFNSDIEANGDIDIESQNGTLNLGAEDDVIVDAGGSVSLSAGQDFLFYGGEEGYIEAEGGGVDITAVNEADIYDSDIYADAGDLNILAGGDIYITDSYLEADENCWSGGNVTVSGDEVQIYDTSIYGDEDVNVYGSDVTIADFSSVDADGGSVDIESDGTLTVGNDIFPTVTSHGAPEPEFDVTISAANAVTLSASGDVFVTDTSINVGNPDENVSLPSSFAVVSPLGSEEEPVNIYSYGGEINVSAGGSASITDSEIYLNGNISISDGDSVSSDFGDVTISTDGAEVSFSAGSLDIDGSEISGGNISISDSTVTANGGDVNIDNYGDFYSSVDGEVDIHGSSSVNVNNITIDDSEITANGSDGVGGNVNIINDGEYDVYSGCGFDLSCSSSFAVNSIFITDGSEISANEGDVTISAVNEVDIDDSTISAEGFLSTDEDSTFVVGGNVNISAVGDVDISDSSTIEASGDVNITSGGSVISAAATTGSSGGGNVDIEDSTIYAGFDSSFGGSVNVAAQDGDVYVYDSVLSASESDTSGGDVTVRANGSIDVEYSDMDADDLVTLCAGDSVTVFDSYESANLCISGWDINAGTDVTLGADENVSVYGGDIYAGGDVYITSGETVESLGSEGTGGSVTISGESYIESADSISVTAYEGSVCIRDYSDLEADDGDINITANDGYIKVKGGSSLSANGSVYLNADGDITICDSIISATYDDGEDTSSDEVSISSGGELSITGSETSDFDIGADHKVCLSGDEGVSIDDALIETLDGCCFDKIRITSADGEIDITDGSELNASGNVLVEAYDDGVNIQDSGISSGGNVTVSADDGMLTINAGNGFIVPREGPPSISYDISADGTVSLSGDCVSILATAIYGGNEVDIASTDGDVKIKDTDIETDGDVNIEAGFGSLKLAEGCADYGVTVTGDGAVNLSADEDVCLSATTVTAEDGDVTIKSGGEISEDSGDDGAGGNVSIINESELNAENGDVNITASDSGGGTITVSDSTIEAIGSINLTADGDVSVSDSQFFVDDSSDPVDYSDEAISAAGDVNIAPISTGGQITITGDEISLQDSQFYLGGGDITIEDGTFINANHGDVNIGTGGIINVFGSSLSVSGVEIVGGSIFISDSTIQAQGGDVNIGGTGQIYFNNVLYSGDYIGAANDISISDTEITATSSGGIGGEVNINAYGTITLQGDSGEWVVSGDAVTLGAGGDLTLQDAVITADVAANDGGDLNITAGGTLFISDDVTLSGRTGATTLSGDNVALSGDEGVSIGLNSGIGSIITADDGDVTIQSADGDVTVDAATITANGGGDIFVDANNGSVTLETSTLAANDDVEIEAGSDDTVGLVMNSDSVTAGNSVTINGSSTVAVNGGSISGNNSVNVTAGTGITINGASVSADDTTYGQINLTSTTGKTTIENGSSLQSFYLTVNSSDGIMIDGTVNNTISGNTMNLTAGNNPGQDICVKNEDLSAFVNITMAAYTLYFDGVNFGSGVVNLGTHDGQVFVNSGYHLGSLGIDNSFYGGVAITDPTQVGSGIGSTPGMYSHANP